MLCGVYDPAHENQTVCILMVNEEEEGSIDGEGHRHRVGCNTNCSCCCCGGAHLIHLYPGLVQHLHNVMLIYITTHFIYRTTWCDFDKLTSVTLMLLFLDNLVRLAAVVKTVEIPISGRRRCREYDCSILNFGMCTSSLLVQMTPYTVLLSHTQNTA